MKNSIALTESNLNLCGHLFSKDLLVMIIQDTEYADNESAVMYCDYKVVNTDGVPEYEQLNSDYIHYDDFQEMLKANPHFKRATWISGDDINII